VPKFRSAAVYRRTRDVLSFRLSTNGAGSARFDHNAELKDECNAMLLYVFGL
jgi:hypothetical protein